MLLSYYKILHLIAASGRAGGNSHLTAIQIWEESLKDLVAEKLKPEVMTTSNGEWSYIDKLVLNTSF